MTKSIVPFKKYKTWLPLEMFADRGWVSNWFDEDASKVKETIDGNKTTVIVGGFEGYKLEDIEVEHDGEYLKVFATTESKFQKNTKSVYYTVDIPQDVEIEAVFDEKTGKVDVSWQTE